MRLVEAGRRLILDVSALDDTTEAEAFGDPDGFGRHRSVKFTTDNQNLSDALFSLADDRVESVTRRENGVYVHFVGTSKADHADPFNIREAYDVLESMPLPAKKTAAKKAAPKKKD